MTVKIGYLGPEGTFSHEAARQYAAGKKDHIPVPFGSIQDAIAAVHEGRADEAVVPIENSLEGAVNATLDMLAFDADLLIKHEMVVEIEQNLMAPKGTRIEDIGCVISHPQPIGQCRRFIASKLGAAEIRLSHSTSAAAEEVAGGGGGKAAIGPASAAEIHGLEIIQRAIQDSSNNHTRFVILSRHDSPKTGTDKTSIVFSTEDRPGSLYTILEIFNLWEINMTRIESRPAKNRLGRYIFFVELEGHRDDADIADALRMVKRKTSFYKFLGSYPTGSETL